MKHPCPSPSAGGSTPRWTERHRRRPDREPMRGRAARTARRSADNEAAATSGLARKSKRDSSVGIASPAERRDAATAGVAHARRRRRRPEGRLPSPASHRDEPCRRLPRARNRSPNRSPVSHLKLRTAQCLPGADRPCQVSPSLLGAGRCLGPPWGLASSTDARIGRSGCAESRHHRSRRLVTSTGFGTGAPGCSSARDSPRHRCFTGNVDAGRCARAARAVQSGQAARGAWAGRECPRGECGTLAGERPVGDVSRETCRARESEAPRKAVPGR